MPKEAAAIEEAVRQVLHDGLRTRDIWRDGFTRVGTDEMGDAVVDRVKKIL
jgi:3-isopropylmalate dehydrogenase